MTQAQKMIDIRPGRTSCDGSQLFEVYVLGERIPGSFHTYTQAGDAAFDYVIKLTGELIERAK